MEFQLVKKFSAFYEMSVFISIFTNLCQFSPSEPGKFGTHIKEPRFYIYLYIDLPFLL